MRRAEAEAFLNLSGTPERKKNWGRKVRLYFLQSTKFLREPLKGIVSVLCGSTYPTHDTEGLNKKYKIKGPHK
jgi:hypothetical protein